MGSKATEDKKLMSCILKDMKEYDLYFLDSMVTNKTVCRELSRNIGVRYISRSVFLDNEADAEYIKGQLRELANQAIATGWAIGIGHDRTLTIKTIAEMITEIRNMGIEIVPVSELLE